MREVFKGYIIFMKDRQTNVALIQQACKSKSDNRRRSCSVDRVNYLVSTKLSYIHLMTE